MKQEFEAYTEYQRVAGMLAFNVRGYIHKARNGAATWYDFADGSRLKVLKSGSILCGPSRDTMWAVRSTRAMMPGVGNAF